MFEDEEGGGYYDYGTGELDNSTLSQLVGNGLDLGSFSPDILNDLRGLNFGGGQGAGPTPEAVLPGESNEALYDSMVRAGDLPEVPGYYPDLYGTPEQIADMERQDQLYSMGQEGLKSVFSDDTEPGSSGGTKGSYREAGPGALGSYKGASYLPGGARVDSKGNVRLPGGKTVSPGGRVTQTQSLLNTLLPLLMMAMAARKGGGASGATIPALTATQRQTPYRQLQTAAGYRPGQGGIRYFEPMQYAPRMAGGGIVDLARLLAAQRMARGGGTERKGLLQGQGDGVSDSIPATIDGERPARLARGEYVVDARTVAELGNGSTDAGAERLDEMRKRIHAKRKKAGVGQDSRAYKDLPA